MNNMDNNLNSLEKPWYVWSKDKDYGEMLYKRATGELEEMQSAKSFCQELAKIYEEGMTIADIGCGAGHYLLSLRKYIDENINYTGIDATEDYLQHAKNAFPNTDFHLGDIYNLDFDDNSFDIVSCSNLLPYLPPPPAKAISELLRISKRYTILRVLIGERNYIVKAIRNSDAGLETSLENGLSYAEQEKTRFNYNNFFTKDFYAKLITKLEPNASFKFVADDNWQTFDNSELTTHTGTKVIAGKQVSGNLIFDWHYLIVDKTPKVKNA